MHKLKYFLVSEVFIESFESKHSHLIAEMYETWERGNVHTRISTKAVQGGRDTDGSVIYVGRASYKGVFLPAKIIPSKNACYVAYGGAELFVENFEVLIGDKDFKWESASDGRIAVGAVATGKDGNEEIFVGRVPFQNSLTVGKVHPSHRCIYFPYNGREERSSNYEVLVHKNLELTWAASHIRDALPRDAVLGGRDSDGAQMYVGRAIFEGGLLPCKVLPSKQAAYVSNNGKEFPVQNYDVLIGANVIWKKDKNGKVPKDAFPHGGRTPTGETLYIGRAEVNGSLTIGKVHPAHKCLYIPYGGSELSFKEYEVLTGK
ncbi:Natterin-3 [Pseudolycoriella hygida]|uniref:Natterin-3 n=1 Tax=Pseudolycoriella hygida TaxID=35572 RepID=A0A9Q0MS48_9DIPT|nr:Natterin-3 [Pseudolycoriella hygida]